MAGKGSVLLVFALVGFIAGILASMSFGFVLPALAYIPKVLTTPWFLSGLVGAFFAVAAVLAYIAIQR
jgi:hypothetical protein